VFEVHLEWQLPGDPESTKLKIRLPISTPSATNQFQTYTSEDVARSYEAGYQAATEAHEASDNWNPTHPEDRAIVTPEPFVSSPVLLGPVGPTSKRGLPGLPPYEGPRKTKNHPTTRDVRHIARLLKQGYTYDEIAVATKFGKTTIARIANGTHSPIRRGTRPASN